MAQPRIPSLRLNYFHAAGLLGLAFIAFFPLIYNGGFFWDDIDLLILRNRLVRSPTGLFDFWFTKKNIDYFPLTMSTFWLEWRLWGAWASPYHLLNVLLHGGSAILLWRILSRLRVPGAYLAAALFVIHPVNAESVAWISERKNTLSMFFMLASLLAYLRGREQKSMPWSIAGIFLFLLALFAKTAVVMFPFVLLILAWYGHGRITGKDILHAIPYFGLSLGLGIVTMIFQRDNAIANYVVRDDGFASRLATAGCAVWFYLFKLLIPINIIFNYPRWDIAAWGIAGFVPVAGLVILLGGLFLLRKPWARALFAALGIYVLMLVPILGFINIFFMRYSYVSDHWQYQAMPAMLACFAAGIAGVYRRFGGAGGAGGIWATRRKTMAGVGIAVGAVLFSYTCYLAWIYREPETIWRQTLRHNPRSWLAHAQLGKELQRQGKFSEALDHFQAAEKIVPADLDIRESVGSALLLAGQPEEALKALEQVKEKDTHRASVYSDLGSVYEMLGDADKAAEGYVEAIRRNPDYAEAHYKLGKLRGKQRDMEAASKEFQTALTIEPDWPEAAFALAASLFGQGRLADSIHYFELALSLRPGWPDALAALAEARAALNQANQMNRSNAPARR